MTPSPRFHLGKVDLAILASFTAMVAMNLFVLAQQIQPAAAVAAAATGTLQA